MFASPFLKVSRNAVFAVAAAALAITAAAGTAEAKHKKHFGIVLNIGGPDYVYADSGYHSCWWLKKKAINTGSSYWWKRYHYCVYG
jgi:hypothetical protein